MVEPEIADYYATGIERDRLAGWSLERVRTTEVLRRALPSPPARVLDVGGAAGRYAIGLTAAGYDVVLLDPVTLHVQQAAGAGGFAVLQGDARQLPLADGAFDAVLMLGPLYHLPDRFERVAVLREGLRVLRPGGPLLAAAISRPASLLDGFARQFHHDARFRAAAEHTVATGHHRNPDRVEGWFTTAYFHRPSDLRTEFDDAGAAWAEVIGVEGPAALFDRPDDEQWHAIDLWAARLAERDPDLAVLSAHLLAIGHKPA